MNKWYELWCENYPYRDKYDDEYADLFEPPFNIYRGWDIKENKWRYGNTICFFDNGDGYLLNTKDETNKRYNIKNLVRRELYIGAVDKNDNLIYPSDILKDDNGEFCIVGELPESSYILFYPKTNTYWEVRPHGYELKDNGEIMERYWDKFDSVEVVGNIKENRQMVDDIKQLLRIYAHEK